jgi:hypothetical protein
LRSAWGNSSQDSISKITRAKWNRVGVAVEHLLCKHEVLSSNPSPSKMQETERESEECKEYKTHNRRGSHLRLTKVTSNSSNPPGTVLLENSALRNEPWATESLGSDSQELGLYSQTALGSGPGSCIFHLGALQNIILSLLPLAPLL